MLHLASLERRARLRTALWLLSAAVIVALSARISAQSRPLGLLLLSSFALTQLPRALQHIRLRRVLRSGDLGAVLKAYHPTLARLPHPETLGPLMVAATLAAHGMVDRARRALDRAVRVPLQRRVVALRGALVALARAFARCPRAFDAELLEVAADNSPLVHWAMRYGAIVAYLERGERERAQVLLSDAPQWPADSAFRGFQAELAGLASDPLRVSSGA